MTNAKSGRTKVADWQDVGAENVTRWSLSNWEREGRFSSNFEDIFFAYRAAIDIHSMEIA